VRIDTSSLYIAALRRGGCGRATVPCCRLPPGCSLFATIYRHCDVQNGCHVSTRITEEHDIIIIIRSESAAMWFKFACLGGSTKNIKISTKIVSIAEYKYFSITNTEKN